MRTARLHPTCAALVYRRHGAHGEVLRLETTALPKAGPRQVRLRMLAAPVNPADINMIQGRYPISPPFPAVGGNEGVAEVLEAGGGVTDLKPGDWVIPVDAGFGTWRTQAVCDAAELLKVPPGLSLLAAATMAVNPCTAYRMLHDFVRLKPGDTVIQNGANSAVGQAIIQICAARGIRSVNVIRDRPNRQKLVEQFLSMGADYVVTEEVLQGPEMEKIFQKIPKPMLGLNCVGGTSGGHLLYHLDDGGTLVTYGGMSKKPLQVPAKALIFRNINIQGFWMTQWKRNKRAEPDQIQRMVNSVCELLRSGRLSVPLCVTLPFSRYQLALEATECPHQPKHILLMQEP